MVRTAQKLEDAIPKTYVYTAVYMLAGDSAVFETYQKRTTLISEWGRVARYHSRVGHRRCWTAAASKGLLSLVCVVLVLVAMRFASWTMMAVICFSVDDFLFIFLGASRY